MRLAIAGLVAFVAACGGDPTPPTGAAYPTPPASSGAVPVPNDGSWSLLEQQQRQALSQDFTSNFLNSVNQRCGSQIKANFDFESPRHHFTANPA